MPEETPNQPVISAPTPGPVPSENIEAGVSQSIEESGVAQAAQEAAAGGTGAAPVPAQPGTSEAQAQHHGVLGEIFQTLAGGKKKEWVQTDKGPVAQYRDLKPGEMARGILAAALTGLASGYDPANRGKGPAMSAAFSGGFQGETQAKEKTAAAAEQEAQKQFQTQGVADERIMAKHRDARENQRSQQEMAEHDLRMTQTKDQIARGELSDKLGAQERDVKSAMQLQALKNSGSVQVSGPDGKPLEFASPHDMMVAASNDPSVMKALTGDNNFDIVYNADPVSGHVSVWKRPPDYATSQRWYGVERNEDGTPKKDKDGSMIPSKTEPMYGPDGKQIVPSSPMTRADFDRRNSTTLEMRSKEEERKAHSVEYLAKAFELENLKSQSKQIKDAELHWNQANGDPNAVGSDGKLILSASDRDYLGTNIIKQYQAAEAAIQKGTEEYVKLKETDPKDPRIKDIEETIDKARAIAGGLSVRQTALMAPANPAETVEKKLRDKYTDPATGKIDTDKAMKDVLMAKFPKELTGDIEKRLKTKAPQAAPPGLEGAVNALKSLPKDQQASQIAGARLQPEQKTALYNYFGITNPNAETGPAGQITMITQGGDKISVEPDQVGVQMNSKAKVASESQAAYDAWWNKQQATRKADEATQRATDVSSGS